MKTKKRTLSENRCRISGLRLTKDNIEQIEGTVDYPINDLDLLLLMHSDKINMKLFDEKFFEPDTIDVIEYRGHPYAIKLAG